MNGRTAGVSLSDTEKTDASTCLNKILADKTADWAQKQANQQDTMGSAFRAEGTLKDSYANAQNEVSQRDPSYLPVASADALSKLITAFMHANEIIEASE